MSAADSAALSDSVTSVHSSAHINPLLHISRSVCHLYRLAWLACWLLHSKLPRMPQVDNWHTATPDFQLQWLRCHAEDAAELNKPVRRCAVHPMHTCQLHCTLMAACICMHFCKPLHSVLYLSQAC